MQGGVAANRHRARSLQGGYRTAMCRHPTGSRSHPVVHEKTFRCARSVLQERYRPRGGAQSRVLLSIGRASVRLFGQDNVPNIADQRKDYLVKALRGYKDNSPHCTTPPALPTNATIAKVMQPISDDQILGLAYYIARVGAR